MMKTSRIDVDGNPAEGEGSGETSHYVVGAGTQEGVIDRFGIPDGMFEPIDDDFAAALGRIAMLGALTESYIDLLVASLDHNPQSRYAGSPLKSQLKRARHMIDTGAPARPSITEQQCASIREVLNRVERAMRQRNDMLHSVWPVPSLNNGRGWRHLPTNQRDAEHEWTRGQHITSDEVLRLIRELADLVHAIQHLTQRVEEIPRVSVTRAP